MKTMKAAVVHGKGDIRLEEIPIPIPQKGEILIKVMASGVCATDVKILGGTGLPKHLPTILGHEVAGTIAAIGDGVTEYSLNDKVAVYPIAACGDCFFCQKEKYNLCLTPYGLAHGADGGFAEYMIIPHQIIKLEGIIPLDDELPFDMAAMIEPISCCISASRMCNTNKDSTVLIIGAGPLGLMHCLISKDLGAKVFVADINEERLSIAKILGADKIINPEKENLEDTIKQLTNKIGVDIVIAAIGNTRIVEKSLPLVRNGGIFNIFGGTPKNETITLDPRWLHYGEIILTGTFAAGLQDFKDTYIFVKDNQIKINNIISGRYPLEKIDDIIQNIKTGKALKSIITFE